MKKLKNIIIFTLIPIFIVLLSYFNAELQAKKYIDKTIDFKQYSVDISADKEYYKAKSKEILYVPITLKNTGTMNWLKDEENSISLSYHILDNNGQVLLHDGLRTSLPHSVRSGEEIKLNAVVEAPENLGQYIIEFDMVHEGVTWFKDKGSGTLKIKLEVE
jgi:hypothetical protein